MKIMYEDFYKLQYELLHPRPPTPPPSLGSFIPYSDFDSKQIVVSTTAKKFTSSKTGNELPTNLIREDFADLLSAPGGGEFWDDHCEENASTL